MNDEQMFLERKYELLFRPAVLIEVKEYEDGRIEVSDYPTIELDERSDFVQLQTLDHPYENMFQDDWGAVPRDVRVLVERLISTLALRKYYEPIGEDEPF